MKQSTTKAAKATKAAKTGSKEGPAKDWRAATLARITSCFPAAFTPVVVPAKSDLESEAHAKLRMWGRLDDEQSYCFLDGGVLDNKPFTPTIREIFYRLSDRAVSRKLFYIEPDPERFGRGSTLYFLSEGADANPYGGEAVYELELGEPSPPRSSTPSRPRSSVNAAGMYTLKRETSISTEIATPVAMNASLVSPTRTRNADRRAPCIPERPPKKPLSSPPTGK